ncbi:unnamed protein product [Leuciscus chuanchicus]
MKVSSVNTTVSRKREHRVLLMVITMVIFYLLCWLPYGIVALLATFGTPGLVTVEASIVPSILAKSSTVINPVIYIFMNKQWNFNAVSDNDAMGERPHHDQHLNMCNKAPAEFGKKSLLGVL